MISSRCYFRLKTDLVQQFKVVSIIHLSGMQSRVTSHLAVRYISDKEIEVLPVNYYFYFVNGLYINSSEHNNRSKSCICMMRVLQELEARYSNAKGHIE